MNKQTKPFWAKIYLSGDINTIKQTCREYCMIIGLCVTINPTLFIYTGGEEYGVEIGLINYPRFPDSEENILSKAIELASKCRNDCFQYSYLILTPFHAIWDSIRDDLNKTV